MTPRVRARQSSSHTRVLWCLDSRGYWSMLNCRTPEWAAYLALWINAAPSMAYAWALVESARGSTMLWWLDLGGMAP